MNTQIFKKDLSGLKFLKPLFKDAFSNCSDDKIVQVAGQCPLLQWDSKRNLKFNFERCPAAQPLNRFRFFLCLNFRCDIVVSPRIPSLRVGPQKNEGTYKPAFDE